ncbi:MAG: TRAP transporter permease [Qingshengfaniella sp.]
METTDDDLGDSAAVPRTEAELVSPLPGVMRVVTIALCVVLTVACLFEAQDLYRAWLGLQLFEQQFLFPVIGLAFLLVFTRFDVRGRVRDTSVPWYDWALAISGFAACIYLAVNYPELSYQIIYRPFDAVLCATIILVLTADGVRRATGPVLLIVLGVFLAYGLYGHYIPGAFAGQKTRPEALAVYLAFDTNALMGIPLKVVATIVVAFLLMSALMNRSGAAEFMNDIAVAAMGRFRGGSAKISTFASAMFGSISGNAVSNVMSTGSFTIPMMKRGGFNANTAGAIEAVASTGGQIMPPVMGAAAFIMADNLGVEYSAIIMAALVPGLLYFLGVFMQVDLEAAKRNIQRIDESRIPRVGPVLRSGWIFILPFAVLVFDLFWRNRPADSAALDACAVLAVLGMTVGYKGRRMTLKDLFWAVARTGSQVIDLIMIGCAVGLVIGTLAKSGLAFALTLYLSQVGGDNLLLLLFVAAVVCIVLGMGMPTIGVYVLVASLVAPSMIEVGVSPMAAHLFVFYFGVLSFITPPVCIAAFTAAKLAEGAAMRTGFVAMRLGWSAFVVPFLFVLSPTLLLQGPVHWVLVDFAAAAFGLWHVSCALVGYESRPLRPWERLLFGLCGLALILPHSGFGLGIWPMALGGVLAVGLHLPMLGALRRAGPGMD